MGRNKDQAVGAWYRDSGAARAAIARLWSADIAWRDIALMGRGVQSPNVWQGYPGADLKPFRGVNQSLWLGGAAGLVMTSAFFVALGFSGLLRGGPLAALPIATAFGTLIGAFAGAVAALGLADDQANLDQSRIRAGQLLVTVSGPTEEIERARFLLGAANPTAMR